MNHKPALPKKRLLTSALLLALAPATHAIAQDQAPQAAATADPNAAVDPTRSSRIAKGDPSGCVRRIAHDEDDLWCLRLRVLPRFCGHFH